MTVTANQAADLPYLDSEGRFDVKLWAAWAEEKGILPWQMTLAEYSQHLDKGLKPLAERYPNCRTGLAGIAAAEADRLSIKGSSMRQHQQSVLHALEHGKVVRPEVLAEYGLQDRAAA